MLMGRMVCKKERITIPAKTNGRSTWKYRLRSLGVRLYLWVILFIIFPVIGVFVYSFWTFEGIMQEEVSQRSIENISGIENEFNSIFDNLVKASNVLSNDESIQRVLKDDTLSYYDRSVAVDKVMNNLIESSNILSKTQITIFDNRNDVYSNWSLNFNDYRFLYREDWVQQAARNNGHLVWRLLEPSFIKENKGKNYVSLARAIPGTDGETGQSGVLITSLGEDVFIDIFQKNKYISNQDDSVFVTNETGKIVMSLDPLGMGERADVRGLLGEVSRQDRGYTLRDVQGERYLVNYYTISRIPWTFDQGEWKVAVLTRYDKIISELKAFSSKVMLFFGMFLVAVLVIAGILTVQIVKPIRRLDKRMQAFNPSDEPMRLEISRKDEIGHLNLAFYNMGKKIKELFDKLEAEHAVREKYRFESLRAQLNPHFLFNTLNTIRWMAILRKADNIVENVDALVNLLSYSMSRGSEIVTLREEIEHLRSYVQIQNSRYGGNYSMRVDADYGLMEARMIRFILQPAVENAIVHGYKDANRRNEIVIHAIHEEGDLVLSVIDDGPGIERERLALILLEEQDKRGGRGGISGIGLKIVHERLKSAYGYKYGIRIESEAGKGTAVRFRLPLVMEEDADNAESDARGG